MSNPDAVYSSGDFQACATVAAAAALFGGTKTCRRILSCVDGLLKVQRASDGATIDLILQAGVPEEVQCRGIVTGGSTIAPSAAAPIKVYF